MSSDNPAGAENQQERLIQVGWVIGFVDGEGCFSIGFIRQPSRRGRRGYKTGYQVAHEFAVTQGEQSLSCLAELQTFFGVGALVPNRRYDDHKELCTATWFAGARISWRRSSRFSGSIPCAQRSRATFEKFAHRVELIATVDICPTRD
jgi:LAGLIDADG endonuclease